MKYSKVIGIVKKSKRLYILTEGGSLVQWMGDGGCLWCMAGTPPLENAGEFFTLYDVSDKAEKNFYTETGELPAVLDTANQTAEELEAEMMTVTVGWYDTVLRCFQYRAGDSVRHLFVRDAYLEPVRDAEYLSFTVREAKTTGLPYLCAKEGFELMGIILPIDLEEYPSTGELKNELEEFTFAMEAELTNPRRARAAEGAERNCRLTAEDDRNQESVFSQGEDA
ncbi:MAG: hypothetical protein LUC87_00560 [Clostridiales bacterium]|nr:hypothetical protein [Clostridiales bacterium]